MKKELSCSWLPFVIRLGRAPARIISCIVFYSTTFARLRDVLCPNVSMVPSFSFPVFLHLFLVLRSVLVKFYLSKVLSCMLFQRSINLVCDSCFTYFLISALGFLCSAFWMQMLLVYVESRKLIMKDFSMIVTFPVFPARSLISIVHTDQR